MRGEPGTPGPAGAPGERGPAGAGFSDQDPLVLLGQLAILPARAALSITGRALALPAKLVGAVLGRGSS